LKISLAISDEETNTVTSRSLANGLMLIDASDGEMFKENKYAGNVYYELTGKLELCISVRVNTSKTKGTFVIARKEYISVLLSQTFTIFFFLLSLSLRERVLSSFSLEGRPFPSLSFHQTSKCMRFSESSMNCGVLASKRTTRMVWHWNLRTWRARDSKGLGFELKSRAEVCVAADVAEVSSIDRIPSLGLCMSYVR